jgi:hypothetical protein
VTKLYRTETTERRRRNACILIAKPAQPPEIVYLNRKPLETVGRKVTGLRGASSRIAGPPDRFYHPLGKPVETQGRKAKGAKANGSPAAGNSGTDRTGCKASPAAGDQIYCLANRGKSRDAKLWGLKRKTSESFVMEQALVQRPA